MLVVIEVFGEKQISREIMDMGRRAENARPLWTDIARQLMDAEEEQFETQGVRSRKWQALKDYTIAEKARHGLDPRILHATLELRNSLTVWGAPGQILDINKQSLRFGTKVKDAIYHQKGTKHMAQRKPVNLTEQDKSKIVRTVHRYITNSGENWSQGMNL